MAAGELSTTPGKVSYLIYPWGKIRSIASASYSTAGSGAGRRSLRPYVSAPIIEGLQVTSRWGTPDSTVEQGCNQKPASPADDPHHDQEER